MKKVLSVALCLMLLMVAFLPFTAQAAGKELVVDDVNGMTEDELHELNEYAQRISNKYQMDVAFFLISNTDSPKHLNDDIRELYLATQALGPDGFALAHDVGTKQWSMVGFGKAEQLITEDIEDRFWEIYVDTGETFHTGALGYLAEAEALLERQATVEPGEAGQLAGAEEQPAPILDASFFAPGSGHYVLDETGTLTNEQITSLNEKAAAFIEKRECGIYIWIVDLVPEEFAKSLDDMEIYADAFYAKHDLGYGDGRDGMVLVLETGDIPGERDYLLNTHGPRSEVISTSRREYLLDEIVPLFKEAFNTGNFYEVADEFLDLLDSQFTIALTMSLIFKLAVVILIPLFVAWCVCGVWKRKMKTAVIARAADHYIPEGGFILTKQTDQFLYQTTHSRKIESSSSSSGGSSSSSSGSSSGGKV